MAIYYLVSTKPGNPATLMWRPADSNGTPTGGAGGSMPVFHNDLIPIPYLNRRYIIQIATNCELYLATTNSSTTAVNQWIPSTLICNGSTEKLIQYV